MTRDIERFMKHVTVGPTEDDCWGWSGSSVGPGYGKFTDSNGKVWRANRYSFTHHNGPIPDGMCVLHECDNPPCANPRHLWAGTKDDNNKDMAKKKRSCLGERNGQSKLSDAEVESIRQRVSAGTPQLTIAREYGLHPSAISLIVNRKRRAAITPDGEVRARTA